MGKPESAAGGQGGLGYIAEPLRALALPIDTLHPDPSNARTHDERNLAAIVASLSRFGQRLPIVVQKQGMIVRAGNGRLAAAKSLGWSHMACVVVDEQSVDATAYAIADNRTAELAGWDDETLASLLQSLPDDARLSSGFQDNDLAALLSRIEAASVGIINDPAETWKEMPECTSEDKTSFQRVIVHFKDANDRDDFARLIAQNITDKTRSLWYPEAKIDRYADKQYA